MQDAMPGPWPARPGSRPSLALPSSPCTHGLPWPRCIHGWLTTSFSSLSDPISPCDFTESSRTRREATWARSAGSQAREDTAGRGQPHLPRVGRRGKSGAAEGLQGTEEARKWEVRKGAQGSPHSRVLGSPLLGAAPDPSPPPKEGHSHPLGGQGLVLGTYCCHTPHSRPQWLRATVQVSCLRPQGRNGGRTWRDLGGSRPPEVASVSQGFLHLVPRLVMAAGRRPNKAVGIGFWPPV